MDSPIQKRKCGKGIEHMGMINKMSKIAISIILCAIIFFGLSINNVKAELWE